MPFSGDRANINAHEAATLQYPKKSVAYNGGGQTDGFARDPLVQKIMKTTDELVRLVSFNGGIIIDASHYTADELVRIASFASGKGSRVTFRGIGNRTTDELVRIASFGNGNVTIDFTA